MPERERFDKNGRGGIYPLGLGSPQALPLVIESGDPYPVHAAIVFRMNPMKSSGQSSRWEKALRKLDLLVSIDTQWSETAKLSHYILPESHYLERDEMISIVGDTISIRQPVIPKVYPETKPGWEILRDLAKVLGFGQYFDFDMDEYNNRLLAPTGWAVQQLKERGVIKVSATPPDYDKFKTPSTKIQLIQPQWAESGGSAVLTWVPPKTQPEGEKLRLLHGHVPFHSNGYTQNNPQLYALMAENDLWINTRAAAARGIKDGDLVEVSNEFGTGKIKARVTDAIRDDCVWMCHGFGTKSPEQRLAYGKGCNDGEFYPIMVTPVSGALGQGDTTVTVRKVGG